MPYRHSCLMQEMSGIHSLPPLKSVIGDYKKPDETKTKQYAQEGQSGEKKGDG